MTPIEPYITPYNDPQVIGTRRIMDRDRTVYMYDGFEIEIMGRSYIHRYKWTSRRAKVIRKLCHHTPFVNGFYQYPKPKGAV